MALKLRRQVIIPLLLKGQILCAHIRHMFLKMGSPGGAPPCGNADTAPKECFFEMMWEDKVWQLGIAPH